MRLPQHHQRRERSGLLASCFGKLHPTSKYLFELIEIYVSKKDTQLAYASESSISLCCHIRSLLYRNRADLFPSNGGKNIMLDYSIFPGQGENVLVNLRKHLSPNQSDNLRNMHDHRTSELPFMINISKLDRNFEI